MKVTIKNKTRVFDGFFKIDEALIEHERFDGKLQTIKRLCFERGDAVAAVIFDPVTHKLLFTEQFRYPAFSRSGKPTIIELVAGMINPGEDKDTALEREIQEELGYGVKRKAYLGYYFLSPGGSSEGVHLYYVVLGERNGNGGGRLDENEDIKVRRYTVSNVLNSLPFNDAKTELGLRLSRDFWQSGY